MAKVDETLARFDRRSPRESYKLVCSDAGVHMQRDIFNILPDAPMAWHRIQSLELDNCLLGTRGCMSLLPIVTVSTTLRKLSVRSCGVADDFVKELCAILVGHPSVRAVDIGMNPLVTVYSAQPIIAVMRNNANMVAFEVDGTHVGENVSHIIMQLGAKNCHNVMTYYDDNYFKMKNLFGYLDENGIGWVLLKSLMLNCPYPVLQEQFIERIAIKKPRKRSDGTISINTFLQLVYMNYKTESEIAKFAGTATGRSVSAAAANTTVVAPTVVAPSDSAFHSYSVPASPPLVDEPYVFIVANWKRVLSAVARYNERVSASSAARGNDNDDNDDEAAATGTDAVGVAEHPHHTIPIALPAEDFHRLRLREFLLLDEQADALVETAARYQEDEREHQEGQEGQPSVLVLSAANLLKASHTAFVPPPSTKPVYAFFKERDAAYIPDILRNGSRLFSMQDLSLLNASTSTQGTAASVVTETAVDPNDPPHTFSLPASVVRMVVDFFNETYNKQPRKKESAIPESPRTRKDKAMEKAAIPIATFLSAEFVTDLEKIRPRLLADYYARNALLIDDCTITLQEMVNVLDELYVQCRVDRLISTDTIEAMTDPIEVPEQAEFLVKHLMERDEEIDIIDPLAF